jgi:hypothetical protein
MIGTSKNIWRFDPRSIGSCQLWFDGADLSTFTNSSGSIISQWRDKSGNSNHLNVLSGSTGPSNLLDDTRQVVNFSSGNIMITTSSIPYAAASTTIFIVAKQVNPVDFDMLFSFADDTGTANTGDYSIRYLSGVLNSGDGNDIGFNNNYFVNGTRSVPSTAATYSSYHLITSPINLTRTGASRVSLSSSFASRFFTGTISEVIVYTNSILTTSQRQQVEGYLGWKWGIQTLLPSVSYVAPLSTSGFTPTSISNCVLWNNASTLTGSGTVGTWPNPQGGYTVNCTGTISAGGRNGLNTVLLTTAQTWIPSPDVSLTAYTLFWSGRKTSTGAGRVLQGTANNHLYGYWSTVERVLYVDANPGILSGITVDTTWDTFSHARTPGGSYVFNWNGQLQYSNTTSSGNGMTGLRINSGASPGETSAVEVGEIILYSRFLTRTEISTVDSYLMSKWGVANTVLVPTFSNANPYVYMRPHLRTFQPNTMLECALWFDAADRSTITLSSGNVTQWNDKSGNGYSVIQPTASNRPTYTTNLLNGLPGIQLTNTTYLYQIGSNIPAFSSTPSTTVFMVAKNGSSFAGDGWNIVNTMWFISNGAGTARYHFSFGQSATNAVTLWGTGSTRVGEGRTVPLNTAAIIGFTISTAGVSIDVNGIRTTFSGATATNANNGTWFVFGDPRGLTLTNDINIYEFIGFNTDLNASQRQQVEGYLAYKWGLVSSLPSVVTAFSPTSITGCQLWLDAADPAGTGVQPANGAIVSTWVDKSLNGRNATGVNNPTYSSGKVIFNTSASFTLPTAFYFTSTGSYTIFSVQSTNNATGVEYFYSFGPNSPSRLTAFVHANSRNPYLGWNGNDYNYNYQMTSGQTFLATNSYNSVGNLRYGYINGVLDGSNTPAAGRNSDSSPNTIGIGPNNFPLNGTISEILIYNAFLTTDQRQQVENYLINKWGIISHSFRSFPPASIASRSISIFSPRSISGLLVWLDGTDTTATGLVPISGGTVSTWVDKSGNGYNFTQASISTSLPSISYTTNGIGVYFGSLQGLNNTSVPFPTSYTIFAVANQLTNSGASAYQYVLHSPHNADYIIFFGSRGGIFATFAGSATAWNDVNANSPASSVATTSGSSSLLCCTNNGTTLTPYFNTVAMTTKVGTNASTTGMIIGSTFAAGSPQPWLGTIYEIIVYNSVLTTIQRQQVEGYLAYKWKLPIFTTVSFNFTGSIQSWTAPAGVTSISVALRGAGGGNGAVGGNVVGTMNVTSGQTYYLLVGGAGTPSGGAGGYGGGGNGGIYFGLNGGGGGGYSGIFTGSTPSQGNALVIAGGGGGGNQGNGAGAGGGNTGVTAPGLQGGGGGTQSAGGVSGTGGGAFGSQLQGGNSYNGSAGGGGGYWGGGAGIDGGGGSGFVGGLSSVTTNSQGGGSSGNGSIVITVTDALPSHPFKQFPPTTQVELTATGGAIVVTRDYTTYHVFTSSSNFVVVGSGRVNYLFVGGGGGGGDRHGGGGGAGGVQTGSFSVTTGTYAVTVGLGGAGGNYEANVTPTPRGCGFRGGDTTISGVNTGLGGGGGGTYDGPTSYATVGSGGGGGGGAGSGNSPAGSPGTAGQGNAGGLGSNPGGGGGGGAGENGGGAPGGSGGIGTPVYSVHLLAVGYGTSFAIPTGPNSVISDGVAYIAGGGGGAAQSSAGPYSYGGLGGGGRGDWDNGVISAGTANTGGGGGASRSETGGASAGFAGGSGLALLWY